MKTPDSQWPNVRRRTARRAQWYRRWGWITLVLLPVALFFLGMAIRKFRHPVYDLVILNGQVFDGERMLPPWCGVAVRRGRVAKIGVVQGLRTRQRIDAWRRVISPGFIEAHAHVEASLVLGRPFRAPNFICMGVTTVITGNCGTSAKEVDRFLGTLDRKGGQTNLATLVGHGTVREAVMGKSRDDPTPQQIDQMRLMVYQAMQQGALGLSTGLEYAPGAFAKQAEIVRLAEVIASWNGIYATHIRDEGLGYAQALDEAIETAREAGVRLHISHLKIAARSRWGEMQQALDKLDKAKPADHPVTQDAYLYNASSTSLSVLLPVEFRGSNPGFRAILQDSERRTRLVQGMLAKLKQEDFADYAHARVANFSPEPWLRGKSIPEIAEEGGYADGGMAQMAWLRPLIADPALRGQIRVILHLLSGGGAHMIYEVLDERNIQIILRHPNTVIGSDSAVRGDQQQFHHPRGYGNFPRVLAKYVRQEKVLGLEEALARMTSRPADIFRLSDRGRLKEGAPADIVVFDPEAIQDRAEPNAPLEPPSGIDYVIVNGQVVCEGNSIRERAFPGRALRLPRPKDAPAPPLRLAALGAPHPAGPPRAVAPAKPKQQPARAKPKSKQSRRN